MTDRYGKFNLRLGDEDAKRRWGGEERKAPTEGQAKAAVGQVVTLGAPSPVLTLKKDLDILGFKYFDKADGIFDIYTELALREFQAYARFETIAEEKAPSKKKSAYCQRLVPVKNTKPYHGPTSGVLNTETATLIALWIEKGWRCPVTMVLLRRGKIIDERFWRFDQASPGGSRSMSKDMVVAARDVSGYYHIPADREKREKEWAATEDGLRRIGRYYRHKSDPHRAFGGCEPNKEKDCWREVTAVTPELCYGKPFAKLDEHSRQSFLVIWTVAQQECEGFLDVINTWDRAIVSFGICHFTFFGLMKSAGKGPSRFTEFKIGTALHLLRKLPETLFEKYFAKLGLGIVGKDGRGVSLETEGGKPIELVPSTNPPAGHEKEAAIFEARVNFFKSWHWSYRYEMAHRASSEVRMLSVRAFVDLYFSKVLQAPWKGGEVKPVGKREPRIADVMPTPYLLGFLAMRHVNCPSDVLGKPKKPGVLPAFILKEAKSIHAKQNKGKEDPRWQADPSTWPSEFHLAMVDALDALPRGKFGPKTTERLTKSFARYRVRRYDAALPPPQPQAASEKEVTKLPPTAKPFAATHPHPLDKLLRLKFVAP